MPPVKETSTDPGAKAAPTERRRNLRFPFTATVEAVETQSGAKIVGRTSDLGLGGCYIDSISPFPVGTETKVRIVKGNEAFESQAKVVYSQIGMGMGVAFISVQAKQFQVFQRWLLEISGQAAPAPEPPQQAAPEVELEPTPASTNLKEEKNYVLNELVITLMRKKVLTEAEGKELLRKLYL